MHADRMRVLFERHVASGDAAAMPVEGLPDAPAPDADFHAPEWVPGSDVPEHGLPDAAEGAALLDYALIFPSGADATE